MIEHAIPLLRQRIHGGSHKIPDFLRAVARFAGGEALAEQMFDFDAVVEVIPVDGDAARFDVPLAALRGSGTLQPGKAGERNANFTPIGELDIEHAIGEASGLRYARGGRGFHFGGVSRTKDHETSAASPVLYVTLK